MLNMKNLRTLLLVPLFVLTACNAQKEISFEKAKEIANQIKNNDSKDSFMFTLSNNGAIGKGEDRITVNLSYKYVYTEKGYYTYLLGNNGNQKFDTEMYCVYNTKHGDVKYVRYFDAKKNDYVKAISTSKHNSNYETAFNDLGVYRTISVYDYYRQVGQLDVELSKGDTAKYYSSKDGELTLEYKTDIDYMTEDDPEWTTGGVEKYVYKDYHLVSVEGNTSSNYGNKWTKKGNTEYNKDLKVDLPEDWESYLKLEA